MEYQRIYGMAIPDVPVEIVTWRLSAIASSTVVEPDNTLESAPGLPSPAGTRPMVFGRGEDPIDTPVYKRDQLGAGATFLGPAVVEERETTSVIRPGWSVEVTADGSLVATRDSQVGDARGSEQRNAS
jgi:N-methylhydantoinase A